jgi:adenylosuccinate lyase
LEGATGNFNAHKVAYPDTDWNRFADRFVNNKLKLKRSEVTTQIEHYDFLASIFDALKRICTIIIDLNRDAWSYISMGYFKQKIKEGEVGSSAMPHKVNPIDFENSEGNLQESPLPFLSTSLPNSRFRVCKEILPILQCSEILVYPWPICSLPLKPPKKD